MIKIGDSCLLGDLPIGSVFDYSEYAKSVTKIGESDPRIRFHPNMPHSHTLWNGIGPRGTDYVTGWALNDVKVKVVSLPDSKGTPQDEAGPKGDLGPVGCPIENVELWKITPPLQRAEIVRLQTEQTNRRICDSMVKNATISLKEVENNLKTKPSPENSMSYWALTSPIKKKEEKAKEKYVDRFFPKKEIADEEIKLETGNNFVRSQKGKDVKYQLYGGGGGGGCNSPEDLKIAEVSKRITNEINSHIYNMYKSSFKPLNVPTA